MGKDKKKRRKLTLDDRICIEAGLARGQSISEIARSIGRSPSVVAREIKRNCTSDPKHNVVQPSRNLCIHKNACTVMDLCGKGCLQGCHRCRSWLCNSLCPEYQAAECPRHSKPPYCCNGCSMRLGYGCDYPYRFYEAKAADDAASDRASDSRSGLDCTEEEFAKTIEIARDGLRNGQSPEHIWHAHPGEMAFGPRNFYKLLENKVIVDITNLDLPKKVRYKPRKKGGARSDGGIPKELLAGRRYDDYEKLDEQTKASAVEMDTVEGRQGKDRQCLLTLMIKRIGFQIMILLPDKTAESVVRALDVLEALMGRSTYARLFQTIVTDRGTEFSNAIRIETGPSGEKRSSVYYCDPRQSQQKPHAERNHSEIRRVLPKYRSNFDALSQRDVSLLMSHVNSYMRNALGWASPIALAKAVFPQGTLEALGVREIDPDLVNLTPMLIPHAIVRQ
ncbi:IS30 family transposase [Olsenella sp. HMSC062G07]|uniref:IS30 family transposase n=1 Tax=Olsenella sp. HMSC062G07 TaxID=1739330 RepID=UPI0008A5EB7D|nr:IS30 family transposase [Olsenella sp. HMSC062G07]OFK23025.1 hypothetical protein HMPREF2826_00080 [Olsenella sp. HMSC062G07]